MIEGTFLRIIHLVFCFWGKEVLFISLGSSFLFLTASCHTSTSIFKPHPSPLYTFNNHLQTSQSNHIPSLSNHHQNDPHRRPHRRHRLLLPQTPRLSPNLPIRNRHHQLTPPPRGSHKQHHPLPHRPRRMELANVRRKRCSLTSPRSY